MRSGKTWLRLAGVISMPSEEGHIHAHYIIPPPSTFFVVQRESRNNWISTHRNAERRGGGAVVLRSLTFHERVVAESRTRSWNSFLYLMGQNLFPFCTFNKLFIRFCRLEGYYLGNIISYHTPGPDKGGWYLTSLHPSPSWLEMDKEAMTYVGKGER